MYPQEYAYHRLGTFCPAYLFEAVLINFLSPIDWRRLLALGLDNERLQTKFKRIKFESDYLSLYSSDKSILLKDGYGRKKRNPVSIRPFGV
ncbi:hypothetical protein AVEN_5068-1 [Araneus ventricosus]|uniref:Uncharacterized protein n=1 Tax=Araneus ventricosus TaxID=182803 RepID=A0A4Y2LGA7_ARAVE|nr:hypothetical protein AVEN_5068-1 [Araneus ventricosus]